MLHVCQGSLDVGRSVRLKEVAQTVQNVRSWICRDACHSRRSCCVTPVLKIVRKKMACGAEHIIFICSNRITRYRFLSLSPATSKALLQGLVHSKSSGVRLLILQVSGALCIRFKSIRISGGRLNEKVTELDVMHRKETYCLLRTRSEDASAAQSCTVDDNKVRVRREVARDED